MPSVLSQLWFAASSRVLCLKLLWQIFFIILVSSIPSIAGELFHPSGETQREALKQYQQRNEFVCPQGKASQGPS